MAEPKEVITEVNEHQFVQLADKESGFVDDETKFQLVRDEVKQVGAPVGRRTIQAIQTGGLLIVDAPKASKKKDGENK